MLKDSLAKFFKVDSLISNVTGYVETRIELLKVEAQEEIAKNLSAALVYAAIAFFAALVIVFISVGAGLWLSEVFGGLAGFSMIAGVYAIITTILMVNRQSLTRKLERKIRANQKKK